MGRTQQHTAHIVCTPTPKNTSVESEGGTCLSGRFDPLFSFFAHADRTRSFLIQVRLLLRGSHGSSVHEPSVLMIDRYISSPLPPWKRWQVQRERECAKHTLVRPLGAACHAPRDLAQVGWSVCTLTLANALLG